MSKRHFIAGMLIGMILLYFYVYTLPDGRLHLVFCNVGQGDAIYIRTPSNQDLLIDGGPDDKVLSCLGKNMPFYDRTIDVVILSHPQDDHLKGLLLVLARFKVKNFVVGVVGNETEGYQKLIGLLKEKNIPLKNLYTGDSFSLGQVKVSIFWPEKKWLAANLSSSLSDLSTLSNLPVLGLTTTRQELNDFSHILHLSFGSFDALFTGDADSHIQPEIMRLIDLPEVEVLKFPHHGSKYGALAEFLEKVSPELAVISVGKNPWGHPTEETLKLLNSKAIKIKRTDREGDIEVVSNGQTWFAK